MKCLSYLIACIFFGIAAINVFDYILSSAFNAIGNEISKVSNTVNTEIDALVNMFSNVSNTVNARIDSMGNDILKMHKTVNTGIDTMGNEFSKVHNTVNTGIDAMANEFSKLPKFLSDVSCSDYVTGVVNNLIQCNPHAFITDTLDTEDVMIMDVCKYIPYIEIVSIALPLVADLATSPIQVICSVWVKDRLNLYSHLKGIDVYAGPSGTILINNDELFYNLSKLNDQHCGNDCDLDVYEFIKLDERDEVSTDTTWSPDNDRFKRGIIGKALSIPTKIIAKKFAIKIVRKFLMKNGVPSTLAFRGPRGLVSVKMTTKISYMIYNFIEKKRLDKNEDDVYDIFVLTKAVPTTFTEKYYANVSQPIHFGRVAAKNFQRELANKKSRQLQKLIQQHDN